MTSKKSDIQKFIRYIITEAMIDQETDVAVENIIDDEEYQDIDSFISFAFEADINEFNYIELQAIARNVTGQPAPNHDIVKKIREEIVGYGIRFIGREKPRSRRGGAAHGTHPFANSGGGGSGMSQGGAWGSGGGGTGAVGGGKNWNSTDSTSLGMGSRRR